MTAVWGYTVFPRRLKKKMKQTITGYKTFKLFQDVRNENHNILRDCVELKVAQLFKRKTFPVQWPHILDRKAKSWWRGERREVSVSATPYCYIKRRWKMPCEQLVPIDRGLVMVSLQSENPRENVAFGTARGQERPTSDNEGTQRSLAAVEQQSTIFSNLTLHQLLIRATSCAVVEL